MGSDSILQSSRLTGGGGVGGNPVLRAGVLRPSVLGPARLGSASTNNITTTTNNVTSSSDNDANGGANHSNTPAAGDIASGSCDGVEGNVVDKNKSTENSSNPFLKDHKDVEEAENKKSDQEDSEAASKETTADDDDNIDESEDRPDPLSLLRKNGMERSNLFAAAKSSIPLVEKSGFVFGQNVHERVVGVSINKYITPI